MTRPTMIFAFLPMLLDIVILLTQGFIQEIKSGVHFWELGRFFLNTIIGRWDAQVRGVDFEPQIFFGTPLYILL